MNWLRRPFAGAWKTAPGVICSSTVRRPGGNRDTMNPTYRTIIKRRRNTRRH